jgi:hypothetical protein
MEISSHVFWHLINKHEKNKIMETFQEKCRNPTLAKCEDETHTPKVGDL